MKYLKTFEAYAGSPVPAAPAHLFANYYLCEDCKEPIATIGTPTSCPDCDSPNLLELTEGEYFGYIKQQNPNMDVHKLRADMKDHIIPFDLLPNKEDEEAANNYGYGKY